MNLKDLGEIKNKKGKILQKTFQITNKISKKGIEFDVINDLYKELLKKYRPKQLLITGKMMQGNFKTIADGHDENPYKTLKSYNHTMDDLKYADDEYFANIPQEIKNKLGKYYSVQITVKNI